MSNPDDLDSYRPDNLDSSLQDEIEQALGGMSLEDLLDQEEAPPPDLGRESDEGLRTGRVISVQGEDIFVEFGGKDQGILSASQFAEGEQVPEEGELIEVAVDGYIANEGLLRLRRKGAPMLAAWSTLATGQIVEARVTGHNKGGLELDLQGIRAFMPISQIEIHRVEDLEPYLNEKFRCEVIEANRSERKVVLSRRAMLEVEAAQARQHTFETIQEGDVVTGTVKTIMPYGAFVDIGGTDGLLHISDMSHTHIKDPTEVVKLGQQIEVKVLKLDLDAEKISLGLKQTLADPWESAAEKWQVDEIVSGRVTRLADFGAFVEIEEGIEGLIPISELTFKGRINHPREVIKEGDVVRVRVLSVEPDRKRMSLSLKRAGDDPWVGASARWPEGAIVEGIVTRLADFGAFVELAAGVDGLVHISELSDEYVQSVSSVVREGDSVRAKVLEVDEDRRRLSLSIKKARTEAAADVSAEPQVSAQPTPSPKRSRPLKGGLD